MRLVVQRVKRASVTINDRLHSEINKGFLVYIGFTHGDSKDLCDQMVHKLLNLRVFEDSDQKMNLNINAINGSILVVSQFTLYGDIKKGNRPSFTQSMAKEEAIILYDYFVEALSHHIDTKSGVFQSHMLIESINDGPVTILYDSN